MTVRPITGNYEVKTEVVGHNTSLKGLVLYGDAGQSVGIGIKGDTIVVWEVKNKKRTVLKEEATKRNQPLQLKMKVEKGYQCRFYRSENAKDWKEIVTGAQHYNGNFLPPWDRSPRPGLLHLGDTNEPAVFSFFDISYQ